MSVSSFISYHRTSQILEDVTRCTPDELEKLLESKKEDFLLTLSSFKSRNDAGSVANSDKLTFLNEEVPLTDRYKATLNRLSHLLDLDEKQCFQLCEAFIREDLQANRNTFDSMADDDRNSAVFHFYLNERRSLLFCLYQLVTLSSSEDAPYAVNRFTSKLFHDGFESKLFQEYKKFVEKKTTQPQPRKALEVEWFRDALEIQSRYLELIYIIYYTRVICKPSQLLEFVRFFQSQQFGQSQAHSPLLDEDSKNIIQRIGYIQTLIVIECLNIEKGSSPLVKDPTFKEFQNEFEKTILAGDIHVQQGPIFLAWAALSISAENSNLSYVQLFGMKAVEVGAMSFLHEVTRSWRQEDVEENICSAYKHTIYKLLSLLTASFSLPNLPEFSAVNQIFCLVVEGQEILSHEYLENIQDSEEIGLEAFVECAKFRFPLQAKPLYDVLRALSTDRAASTIVQDMTGTMSTYTHSCEEMPQTTQSFGKYFSIQPAHLQDHTRAHHSLIQCKNPFETRSGFIVPRGAIGIVTRITDLGQSLDTLDRTAIIPFEELRRGFEHSLDTSFQLSTLDSQELPPEPSSVVQWRFNYSVYHHLDKLWDKYLSTISQRQTLSRDLLEACCSSAQFLSTLLTQDCTKIAAVEEILRGSFLEKLFRIVGHTTQLQSHSFDANCRSIVVTFLEGIFRCIIAYARLRPDAVVRNLTENSLVPALAILGSTTSPLSSCECILRWLEIPTGSYGVTTAFSELLSVLASHHNATDSGFQTLRPYVLYLRDVFAETGGWRYNKPAERYDLCGKILEVFYLVLRDRRDDASATSLISDLLLNHGFHTNLFNSLCIGMDQLERGEGTRRTNRIFTLEKMLASALRFTDKFLSYHQSYPQYYPIVSSMLDWPIQRRNFGTPTNLIRVISNYIRHNSRDIVLYSTLLTAALCSFATVEEKRASIVAYIGEDTSSFRRAWFRHVRDERDDELRNALLRLLTRAAKYQPGLAELLMSRNVNPLDFSSTTLDDGTSLKSVLLQLLADHKAGSLSRGTSDKGLTYRLFYTLKVLWDHCSQYNHFVNSLRASEQLWAGLVSILTTDAPEDSQTLMSQAFVLHLITTEVYCMTQVNALDHHIKKTIEETLSSPEWLKRITLIDYDQSYVKYVTNSAETRKIRVNIRESTKFPRLSEDSPALVEYDTGSVVDGEIQELNRKVEIAYSRCELFREWSELVRICTKKHKLIRGSMLNELTSLLSVHVSQNLPQGPPSQFLQCNLSVLINILISRMESPSTPQIRTILGNVTYVSKFVSQSSTPMPLDDSLAGVENLLLRMNDKVTLDATTVQCLYKTVQLAATLLSEGKLKRQCIDIIQLVLNRLPEQADVILQLATDNGQMDQIIRDCLRYDFGGNDDDTFCVILCFLQSIAKNSLTAEYLQRVQFLPLLTSSDILKSRYGKRDWDKLVSIISHLTSQLWESQMYQRDLVTFILINHNLLLDKITQTGDRGSLPPDQLDDITHVVEFFYTLLVSFEDWWYISNFHSQIPARKIAEKIVQLYGRCDIAMRRVETQRQEVNADGTMEPMSENERKVIHLTRMVLLLLQQLIPSEKSKKILGNVAEYSIFSVRYDAPDSAVTLVLTQETALKLMKKLPITESKSLAEIIEISFYLVVWTAHYPHGNELLGDLSTLRDRQSELARQYHSATRLEGSQPFLLHCEKLDVPLILSGSVTITSLRWEESLAIDGATPAPVKHPITVPDDIDLKKPVERLPSLSVLQKTKTVKLVENDKGKYYLGDKMDLFPFSFRNKYNEAKQRKNVQLISSSGELLTLKKILEHDKTRSLSQPNNASIKTQQDGVDNKKRRWQSELVVLEPLDPGVLGVRTMNNGVAVRSSSRFNKQQNTTLRDFMESKCSEDMMRTFDFDHVYATSTAMPCSLATGMFLTFGLNQTNRVNMSIVANCDSIVTDEISRRLPSSFRSHGVWSCLKRFCGSWSVSKQKGIWKYVQLMMLEWPHHLKGDPMVPDVSLLLHGGRQNKRMDIFLIVKFMVASLLMSSVPAQMEPQLTKMMNLTSFDVEIQKITIMTSQQMDMNVWTTKPSSIRIAFSGMSHKELPRFLKDIDWQGNREAAAQLAQWGQTFTEDMWLEVDVTSGDGELCFYFFFSHASGKIVLFFAWLIRENYITDVNTLQSLITDPNINMRDPPKVPQRRLGRNQSEVDDATRRLSHVKITMEKKADEPPKIETCFEMLNFK
ncbi:hypothetical protein PROFUN_10702 [Planoprotostelium fungivorum]|uniref:Nucleoporin Nup188 N-terminal subdomain III domain-containing protein n=1 Tax=Planoprotostelium fungivorum TaxID=1890364 RepID=A0A2P6N9L7_9EUKA|nr:hypothetical protein PROFUN_10702 [Planoprotostelium fungivorum]